MSETPSKIKDENYRVLARKYRPTNFDELIGQEAMVRTLSNAIETGRLAHAFILTGVRGVGKTTTARIIAKALNCIGPDGKGGPTIAPCGQCDNCTAIAESRHVDVMEMDAASRTGVDDIREIIEGVRYAAVSARFKIYIIDEVHMLSRNAFNALLKTLEEPPEHVKFIFATTEIRKVPVTVLSRCQRFDLRRISIEQLNAHFSKLAKLEGCEIEDKALSMISRAAEGSVRDGLSLLDQAFAHGAGAVSEQQVRDMLGLADRAQVLDLYKAIMKGDTADALTQLRHQYDHGADPVVVLSDMLELTHWLTRLKVVPDAGEDIVTSEAERKEGMEIATGLSMPILTRSWQMLMKGLEEVRIAPSPLAATEMVLVRMTYAAKLPTPGDMVKKLQDNPQGGPGGAVSSGGNASGGNAPAARGAGQISGSDNSGAPKAFQVIRSNGQARILAQDYVPAEVNAPDADVVYEPNPETFADLVALFERYAEASIAFQLNDNIHLEKFEPGIVVFRQKDQVPSNLIGRMADLLKQWTGKNWLISQTTERGDDTLYEQELEAERQLRQRLSQNPLIKAVLEQFPTAQISDIRKKADEFLLLDDGSHDFVNSDFLVDEEDFGLE
ncbi:DNA polymerase III subunit gamma/tau [Paremcibacter congregatus]|uniref:DNA polymerase III subunit gamma/tau n=1 Tax=Paremcibacter congregatus TaxID=2043170 RepID=A0A2G4YYW7_9PROT|nr:DNA polymerase III subunit gamma/tau [Paremcibacter congregatus]PHZ86646.1 DNA polymerase III subunit gamma/tau [Paremcibacter congregatus]QDE26447.1 DNA polymerase III subunit gamma/tau [Paremcibacter congregatus]